MFVLCVPRVITEATVSLLWENGHGSIALLWLFSFIGGPLIAVCGPLLILVPRNGEPLPRFPYPFGNRETRETRYGFMFWKFRMGGNRMKKAALLILVILMLTGCRAAPASSNIAVPAGKELPGLTWESGMALEYATEFSVDYYEGGYALIEVAGDSRYLAVPEDREVPEGLDGSIQVLQQPLDTIYLQATSAMALFDRIDGLDAIRLVGTRKDGWYVENAVTAMEKGDILFSGSYSQPDYELMVEEGCDLAVVSTMILHAPKVQEMIEQLGIPVFVEHTSYEKHPLGRTEWVKLYGVLLSKEQEAETFFQTQADAIYQFADMENTGKTVAFFYLTSNGSVNVRASSDYVPKMIEISGGNYISVDNEAAESRRSSVSVTMEEFYNAAVDADYLIYNSAIDDPIYTIDELIAKDSLFADFKAVKSGDVWCTGKYLFQATDITGDLIVDFHHMLTGQEEMHFLYRLK